LLAKRHGTVLHGWVSSYSIFARLTAAGEDNMKDRPIRNPVLDRRRENSQSKGDCE
jgi:hypothetical protein